MISTILNETGYIIGLTVTKIDRATVAPPGTDLNTLNDCPLNTYCDIWGQCGTTTEFCTPSNSSTGTPGTAAAGTNGCI